MFATTLLGYTLSTMWVIFWSALIILAWVFLALLPASIARGKGRSFWGFFFLSIFFWWITLFWVLFMKDESAPVASSAPTEE